MQRCPPTPVGQNLTGEALKGIFKALKSYWKKNNANYEFLVNSYLLSHRSKHFGIVCKTLLYTPLRSCSTFLKYCVSQMAEYRNPLETTFFLFFFFFSPVSEKIQANKPRNKIYSTSIGGNPDWVWNIHSSLLTQIIWCYFCQEVAASSFDVLRIRAVLHSHLLMQLNEKKLVVCN